VQKPLSIFRLNLMRLLYLLNFAVLGFDVWPAVFRHVEAWDPMHGVAMSFWAALSGLSVFGLRYPAQMLPLLLIQQLYKSVWLLAVALPSAAAGEMAAMTQTFVIGWFIDLVVIPWPYVVQHYFRQAGERWR